MIGSDGWNRSTTGDEHEDEDDDEDAPEEGVSDADVYHALRARKESANYKRGSKV